jgi:MFS family permease
MPADSADPGSARLPLEPAKTPLTPTQWLICVIAAIGFAFDIYELLMLPLIVRPALLELVNVRPGTPQFERYVGLLFFVPAFAGGIFGLIGGYLTDRLGRRRVLTWSILLYAFSAFAAGFATNFWMLLVLRCLTFVGVCVEFVAAVAWLAELFPDPQRREKVLGYTQAFSSLGGFLVAGAFALANEIDPTKAWRYTLMSGVIPALPLIIIRPFLPESPAWAAKKAAGTLRRPSILTLFAPAYRRTTVVTTIMFACSYGAAFGAIQHMPRMVPGMADVKLKTVGKPVPEQRQIEQGTAAAYQTVQESGGLVGRFLLAYLAVRILSRRMLLRIFQVPGIILLPITFAVLVMNNRTLFEIGGLRVTTFAVGIFLTGLVTVAQFSFWGNYLPLAYPLYLRGTGESFAANIGGRMFGTSFALLTTTLAGTSFIPGSPGAERLANTAAIVGLAVFVAGFLFSFFLPEVKPEGIDEHEPVSGAFPVTEPRTQQAERG